MNFVHIVVRKRERRGTERVRNTHTTDKFWLQRYNVAMYRVKRERERERERQRERERERETDRQTETECVCVCVCVCVSVCVDLMDLFGFADLLLH